jgi:hypothetical protein
MRLRKRQHPSPQLLLLLLLLLLSNKQQHYRQQWEHRLRQHNRMTVPVLHP